MPHFSDVQAALAKHSLAVFGGFHPAPSDAAPTSCKTLLLVGPDEPGFWPHVTACPEFNDGQADPLDRWSRRVIGTLACGFGVKALFPFGGAPYHPFLKWAERSGEAWPSPIGLLVHHRAGLMVSYRGALCLKERIDLPPPPKDRPCDTCAAPCLSACPVGALTQSGYDVPACHAYLDSDAGSDCLTQGCQVRRACPVSQSYGRQTAQSEFHMRSFHL